MDSLPIKYLEKISTIRALKTLLYFLHKAEEAKSDIVEFSFQEIEDALGTTRNTIKNAIGELTSLGLVIPMEMSMGRKLNKYKITLIESTIQEKQEWRMATATKKKEEVQESEIIQTIKDIKFDHIELLREDINSMSTVNMNIYMNDKELGALALRVVREVYGSTLVGRKPPEFFSVQMKQAKDLLVAYRTEQVVAAIIYWTRICPTQNGLTSLKFLSWSRKNRSGVVKTNLMIALDYFKQQFMTEKASEIALQETEKRIDEIEAKKKVEQEEIAEEKQKVESMSDDDFVKNMFSSFGKIDIKKD